MAAGVALAAPDAPADRSRAKLTKRRTGVVWAQNCRFVYGDIGLISYSGLNSLDTSALCTALAP